MTAKIAIINYQMGNLRSVRNAFLSLGFDVSVAEVPADLDDASHIVLPGVGAFGDGMRHLHERGWVDSLERNVRRDGKAFLGICLGMQLLATAGTEYGDHQGLGWIAGTVTRLQPGDDSLRIPHIGWNDTHFLRQDGVFAELPKSEVFYYVHSFAFRPEDPATVSATCTHGETFAAALQQDNIHATQFHPEKSQKAGLRVLRNFVSLEGR